MHSVPAGYAQCNPQITKLLQYELIWLTPLAKLSNLILEGDLIRKVGNFKQIHDLMGCRTQSEA